MKILVVGDLHGKKPRIYFKHFDAIIAPGDFCSDRHRKYIFEVLRRNLENPKKKFELKDIIGKRKAEQVENISIKDGKKILEFLNSFNVPVFAVPGNWEHPTRKWNKMIKKLKNLKDLHFKKKSFDGTDFIGYGYVAGPEIPKYKEDRKILTKKELDKEKRDYKKRKDRLLKLFKKSKSPIIFIPHNIPFNTSLDKITNKDSPRYGFHYGSVIAREIIEKYKPLLCIGGHMHEHFGKIKLGKTTVINAGFGRYVNILIDLDEKKGKIRKITFKRGKK